MVKGKIQWSFGVCVCVCVCVCVGEGGWIRAFPPCSGASMSVTFCQSSCQCLCWRRIFTCQLPPHVNYTHTQTHTHICYAVLLRWRDGRRSDEHSERAVEAHLVGRARRKGLHEALPQGRADLRSQIWYVLHTCAMSDNGANESVTCCREPTRQVDRCCAFVQTKVHSSDKIFGAENHCL